MRLAAMRLRDGSDTAALLSDGAVLETSIQGIGTLRNRVRHTNPTEETQ